MELEMRRIISRELPDVGLITETPGKSNQASGQTERQTGPCHDHVLIA